MRNGRRVVITGMGMITPLGCGLEGPWRAMLEGRSGVGPITRFDARTLSTRIAAEVKDFDVLQYMSRPESRKTDLFIQYAIAASEFAMQSAGFLKNGTVSLGVPATRAACIVGVGLGGLPVLETAIARAIDDPNFSVNPFVIPAVIPNLAASHLAMRYGLKGPSMCCATACASGLHSIIETYRYIADGSVDLGVAGGTEGAISPFTIRGFSALRALSINNDDPQRASRPFDYRRDGFVLGEGAGVVVLEERSLALERGARIYGEVVGYGLGADAYHITAPDPEGEGAFHTMKMAVDMSGLGRERFGYVNAHGSSTLLNDYVEVAAIRRLFVEHVYRMAISSTKSSIGHLLGGSGGVGAICTTLAIHEGWLPPTINLEHTRNPAKPDGKYFCDPEIDYVPGVAVERPIQAALCNSFGFGGANATLAIAKADIDGVTSFRRSRTD
jgi:3-oxoacyl-[acyl-carrier-protein] synthase II